MTKEVSMLGKLIIKDGKRGSRHLSSQNFRMM